MKKTQKFSLGIKLSLVIALMGLLSGVLIVGFAYLNYSQQMALAPFGDMHGAFVGSIEIDCTNIDFATARQEFIIQLSIATFFITCLVIAILIRVLYSLIVKPVNNIARAANDYLAITGEVAPEKNPITKLNVETADELGDLARSLKDMESKIQDYLKSLVETTQKAETDSMTGLLNRRAFEKRVSWVLEEESFEGFYVFMMLDIDNFKHINDTWRHSAGDSVIKTCSAAIRSRFRPGDHVARMGGDEFAVFYHTPQPVEAILKRAESINATISAMGVVEEIEVTLSIGIALLDASKPFDYQGFYIAADGALYDAKALGRNGRIVKVEI